MSNIPLKGIIVPLVTPLSSDTQLDKRSLRKLVRHCVDGSVQGIFPGGTSGFGPLLPQKVWNDLMETVLEEAGDTSILMAGAMAPSTVLSLERVKILEKMGYRRFVATTPFYISPKNDEEHRRHFFTLSNSTSMEMVIYNIPICTGVHIPETIVNELSIKGASKDCKDSSGDDARFERLCKKSDETGLRMYMGMKPDIKRLHKIGASGCVPIPANVFPSLFSSVWLEPNTENQSLIDNIWDVFVKKNDFLSATLYALSLVGIGSEHHISPYSKSDQTTKHSVKRVVEKYF